MCSSAPVVESTIFPVISYVLVPAKRHITPQIKRLFQPMTHDAVIYPGMP